MPGFCAAAGNVSVSGGGRVPAVRLACCVYVGGGNGSGAGLGGVLLPAPVSTAAYCAQPLGSGEAVPRLPEPQLLGTSL